MKLKERIENNLTIWMLSVLLAGFLAGIGVYEGILKIAKLSVVPTSTTPSAVQHLLRIKGMDLDLDSENRTEKAVRIIAVVNGSAKSYPTDGSWSPPNPDLSAEPFTVPEGTEYVVRFEVLAKDAHGSITRFVAPSGHTIPARQLPTSELRIELREEDTGGHVGGRVRFSME